ncbi:MAG TPA: hypothetical protein VN362_09250 [Xanthobacteraceae bacterium]|jgi:hypothetical protein|nr:hypothetical protein [Xanthobacteraceae bacterium]
MTDPPNMTSIANIVAAAGGLGTAAMGLVDTTKLFGGGPSNFGFGYIKDGLKPYLDALPANSSAYGRDTVLQTLRANWLNGVAKADQKAKAKSLIHLGLTQGNTDQFAKAAGVNAATLKAVAANVAANQPVDPKDVGVLGQFDAALSGALDTAYERGDQKYRNATKFLSMVVAIVLGGAGGEAVFPGDTNRLLLCLLIGVVATPLAPVSKDLVSALQAAATSLGKLKS